MGARRQLTHSILQVGTAVVTKDPAWSEVPNTLKMLGPCRIFSINSGGLGGFQFGSKKVIY